MLYIGKSHNLWHRVTLSLEKMMIDNNFEVSKQDCYEFEPEISPQRVCFKNTFFIIILLSYEIYFLGCY